MSNAPAVSVIMPAYNAAVTVKASVQMLLAQTFSNWEAVIIDDGSKDNTLEILREIERKDSRIHVITQSNQRQAAARNAGIAKARGHYIAFLDADDFALPERFAKQVAFLDQHTDVTVLGGGRIDFDSATGVELGVTLHPEDHDTLCSRIFTECPFTTSTVMARADFFQSRHFDPAMPPCEDHDLWIRSYHDNGIRFQNLNEPLVRYACRKRIGWIHYRQMSRMYRRALREEGRWPWKAWYALRPLVAAVRFNPLGR
jgi:glycosyltransferase involved in cell wall biosynthesis